MRRRPCRAGCPLHREFGRFANHSNPLGARSDSAPATPLPFGLARHTERTARDAQRRHVARPSNPRAPRRAPRARPGPNRFRRNLPAEPSLDVEPTECLLEVAEPPTSPQPRAGLCRGRMQGQQIDAPAIPEVVEAHLGPHHPSHSRGATQRRPVEGPRAPHRSVGRALRPASGLDRDRGREGGGDPIEHPDVTPATSPRSMRETTCRETPARLPSVD